MKSNIHPDYHKITVVMTDGTKYDTYSTYGKEGDTLQLDVDPKTHPAWTGGMTLRKTGQMEKFTNKFAFLDKKSNDPAVEAASKAEAAAKKAAKAKKEVKADKDEQKEA